MTEIDYNFSLNFKFQVQVKFSYTSLEPSMNNTLLDMSLLFDVSIDWEHEVKSKHTSKLQNKATKFDLDNLVRARVLLSLHFNIVQSCRCVCLS